MNITKQQSPNECGVCVINSFINYFYKNSDKLNVLNAANITSNGLSIFDFENLGQKFGLYIESYECDWDDFINLKLNKYYSVLISVNNALHYTIFKKNKKNIEIYDSFRGKYTISYSEFNKIFQNIIFEISKSKTTIKYESKKINLQAIDLNYLLISIFLHLCILGLSTLFANLFNWYLNFSIYPKSIQNLIYLCFIFLIIGILNAIMNYLLKNYGLIKFKKNFRYLTHKLINSLNNKQKSFFNKIEPNSFFLLDSSIVCICNYLTVEITSLITEILMMLLTLIILIFIKPIFVIFFIFYILINCIFGMIHYNFKQKVIVKVIDNSNINNQISKDLINLLKKEENNELMNFYLEKYKNNFYEFEKIYSTKAMFENNTNLSENILLNLIHIFSLAFGAYLLINEELNLGVFAFLLTLLTMFNSSVSNISLFPSKIKEYEKMSAIYWSIVNLNNFDCSQKNQKIKKIKSLIFKKDAQIINIKNNLNIKNPSFIPSENNFLSINGKIVDKTFFKDRFILINPDTKISIDYLKQNFSNYYDKLTHVLKYLKININVIDESIQQQQLINYIFCCMQKDKIICFNDCFKYLSYDHLSFIKQNTKSLISKENFVFFISN